LTVCPRTPSLICPGVRGSGLFLLRGEGERLDQGSLSSTNYIEVVLAALRNPAQAK